MLVVTSEDLDGRGYVSGKSGRPVRSLLFLTGLIGLVCGGAATGLAQWDVRKLGAIAPIAATVTVIVPSRDLPGELADLEIEVKQLSPLPFRELAGLVADLAGVKAVRQVRPGRVLEGDVELVPAVPFGLSMRGTVPQVLDELARLSGYDWGWEDGTLIFYRYADSEQRRPERMPGGIEVGVLAALTDKEDGDGEGEAAEGRVAAGVPGELEPGGRAVASDAVAAVEGQAQADAAEAEPAGPAAWQVDPDVHGTVEGVLRAWADRVGWKVAWNSERQFKVGAVAEFPPGETEEAGFLGATDALLAIGPMRRALSATVYPNRWLVIRDVGGEAR